MFGDSMNWFREQCWKNSFWMEWSGKGEECHVEHFAFDEPIRQSREFSSICVYKQFWDLGGSRVKLNI